MPISPENAARYPKDWRAISLRIKERAAMRCEGVPGQPPCGAIHGERHPITQAVVVLTVAHLGRPSEAPFLLHMARPTVTNEVVELIGFFVPRNPEVREWPSMMHDRTIAEFTAGPPAGGAGFVVTLQSGASGSPPGRPVVFASESATPIWIRLTKWRLFSEPFETAGITAESSACSEIETRYDVALSAAFARTCSESALRGAEVFVAAGFRTSLSAVSGLLSGEIETGSANHAVSSQWASSWSRHIPNLLYHMDQYPENCADENLRALCQRCHNRYDVKHRRKNAAQTLRRAKRNRELFGGWI